MSNSRFFLFFIIGAVDSADDVYEFSNDIRFKAYPSSANEFGNEFQPHDYVLGQWQGNKLKFGGASVTLPAPGWTGTLRAALRTKLLNNITADLRFDNVGLVTDSNVEFFENVDNVQQCAELCLFLADLTDFGDLSCGGFQYLLNDKKCWPAQGWVIGKEYNDSCKDNIADTNYCCVDDCCNTNFYNAPDLSSCTGQYQPRRTSDLQFTTGNFAVYIRMFPPMQAPTTSPTQQPTSSPTISPTAVPTKSPTTSPTSKPTVLPSTSSPSQAPTSSPTTSRPTQSPTVSPSRSPTETTSPTASPIVSTPTTLPTSPPMSTPSISSPTSSPISTPTVSLPTTSPTSQPSSTPTLTPTVIGISDPSTLSTSTSITMVVDQTQSQSSGQSSTVIVLVVVVVVLVVGIVGTAIYKHYHRRRRRMNTLAQRDGHPQSIHRGPEFNAFGFSNVNNAFVSSPLETHHAHSTPTVNTNTNIVGGTDVDDKQYAPTMEHQGHHYETVLDADYTNLTSLDEQEYDVVEASSGGQRRDTVYSTLSTPHQQQHQYTHPSSNPTTPDEQGYMVPTRLQSDNVLSGLRGTSA